MASVILPDVNNVTSHEALPEVNHDIAVSIIVPVYNYRDKLEACLNSVVKQQTKYRYQVIIVDDGSNDGSDKIIAKFADKQDVFSIRQENKGIAGARNTGLKYATGKYIMLVDCDDVVEESMIDEMLTVAGRTSADIVMCGHDLVKMQGEKVLRRIPHVYPCYDLQHLGKEAWHLNFAGLPWGKLYRRELWEKVRFFEGLWYEDTIIHSLIFTQCKNFQYLPSVKYHYIWYENNYSHTQGNASHPKAEDIYPLLANILRQVKELNLLGTDVFEKMLLKHLSMYYYQKISKLEEKTIKKHFGYACKLYEIYGQSSIRVPYMLQQVRQSLLTGNFCQWRLSSCYQR